MTVSFLTPKLYWLLNLGVCQLYPFYKTFVQLYGFHFKKPKSVEQDGSSTTEESNSSGKSRSKSVYYGHYFLYWGVYLLYSYLEGLFPYFKMVPFYYELKLLFFFWLGSEHFKGAGFLYHKYLKKGLSEYYNLVKKYFAETLDEKTRDTVVDLVKGFGSPRDVNLSKNS